jgi:N utilization substance protein B
MLNRRQLRIKILQSLYAFYTQDEGDVAKTENELFFSIDKDYELYLRLLQLVVEMQDQAIERIEAGKNKKLPTPEDLNPNTKFVTNSLLRMLSHSKVLKKACESRSITWQDNPDLVKKMFRALTVTEDYLEYMTSKERGFEHDKDYLIRFFKKHLVNEELLHDYLEEKSIFWNDDLDIIASMVIKTMKIADEESEDITLLPLVEDAVAFAKFKEHNLKVYKLELLPLWKSDEDEVDFVKTLFRNTIGKGEDNAILIDEYTKNWELERIASMDIILMKMALAEAQSFPSIPLKVTLNEYIELSKYYSTPKSNSFINGVLDQLFVRLKEDGLIKKTGRGLLE